MISNGPTQVTPVAFHRDHHQDPHPSILTVLDVAVVQELTSRVAADGAVDAAVAVAVAVAVDTMERTDQKKRRRQ